MIDKVKKDRSIANPPEVGTEETCIPLVEGFDIAIGYLMIKKVKTKVDMNDKTNSIISYFI
tara:strand:- start:3797 stop:3979 length:183 start_codon:yes stop_codon:yes gene_type:complete